MYDEDDLIRETTEEQPSESKPDPLDAVLQKLESLEARLPKDQEEEAGEELPVLPDIQPDDPTYGFDPERIVEGAAEQAKATFIALESVKADLLERFGGDLPEEDIAQILRTLATMPYSAMKDAVQRQGHILMGYAKLGEAYKGGKLQQKKPAIKPMPATAASADASKSNPLVQHFESVFGPIKSKRQLRRLLAEYGQNDF